MAAKRVFTTGDVARHCGVHFRTVIRWIERGRLKAYQLPGRGDNRIELADFLAFLKSNEMPIPEDLLERSRRVLLVEDDLSMARAMERVLRRAGFETMIASNGFRAGLLLGVFTPSVMTLDLRMPGLPGLDVLKSVRATQRLNDVKILVVSALPRKDIEEALASGANDCLEKPFENAAFIDKVTRLAGDGSPASAGNGRD